MTILKQVNSFYYLACAKSVSKENRVKVMALPVLLFGIENFILISGQDSRIQAAETIFIK